MIATYPNLIAEKRTYHYTVRYADNSTEPFDITILPRKGQNETHAINALRETLDETKKLRCSTPVLIITNSISEEG